MAIPRDLALTDVAMSLVPGQPGQPPRPVIHAFRLELSAEGFARLTREGIADALGRFHLTAKSIAPRLTESGAEVDVVVRVAPRIEPSGQVAVAFEPAPSGRLRVRLMELKLPSIPGLAGSADAFFVLAGQQRGVYPAGIRALDLDLGEWLAGLGFPMRLEGGVRAVRSTPAALEIDWGEAQVPPPPVPG